MRQFQSLFLSQAYQDAWADAQRSLRSASYPHWDYVVLTASNAQQAEGFEAQIQMRRDMGLLPEGTRFAVLPDPQGKRVGSGGATLGVLRYIAQQRGAASFEGLRILVIHSGGDSKRVPQYSALGKLFSPVPHELADGRVSTLFDELMAVVAGVPARIREGMMLLSGDVLLLFHALQVDDPGDGAAVLSFKEDVQTGKNHGVFLRGGDGCVARFLHKQTVETLRGYGAVNEQGCVDIDTGAMLFSAKVLSALFGLVMSDGRVDEAAYASLVNDRVRLSLYGDFLYPMASESTLDAFYLEKPEGAFCPELREARTRVWQALRPFRMKLLRLAPAKFVHFGTTREIMRMMCEEIPNFSHLGWKAHANSSIDRADVAGYSSVLSPRARCGEHVYLEVSYVHHGATIGRNVLLSHVDIHDETVPDDVVLHGLKQRDGRFVVRIYGVEDNPKGVMDEGCTLLGMPLRELLAQWRLDEEDLWDGGAHTLWEARLYPACATIEEAVAAALNLYALTRGQGALDGWRAGDRKSLRSGFEDADAHALMAWSSRMGELVRMNRLARLIHEGRPAREGKAILGAQALTPIQRKWLAHRLQAAPWGEAMRLHFYVGAALGGAEGEAHIANAFSCIRQSVLEGVREQLVYRADARIAEDRVAVRLPLRVNWGGGWSDTPPYCHERGGTVLNAAVLLRGRMPVEVTLERIPERRVIFDSRDMDTHGEFTALDELQRTGDPYDPFALQKAALLACGVIPASGGSLPAVLERLGGGFRMQTEVTGVPKGSGLGTSSILAAACVKALYAFMGIPHGQDELYQRVLCMEQIMSTGGGWQDQVGGLTMGVKYITTLPGLSQAIRVQQVRVPEAAWAELNARFCLIYTGQRRLARNLLRDVVGRYIGNEPESLFALNEIQRMAALMRFELERGSIDAFAQLLDEHWELSRRVDAGSTNTLIEQIFASVDDLIAGRMVCGAGGGGFLQVMLKRGVRREQLRARLKAVFQDSEVDVWDCTLAPLD